MQSGRLWPTFLAGEAHEVDGVLAPIYGLPAPAVGQRLLLPLSERSGFLGSIAFARLTSSGAVSRPIFADLSTGVEYRQTSATYNKGLHADLMLELITLAFQCDLTRVISYMLEDERREFVYDHVKRRTFSATGSVESEGVCGEYNAAQRGDPDGFASITQWNVAQVAKLCDYLGRSYDANGKPLLDNTVIFLGSCMHGTNQKCSDLPALLIGNGGGALKTDQHVALDNRPLRDLYATLMNGAFALGITDFGVNRTGAALRVIDELLA